jgi:hypothetical protein
LGVSYQSPQTLVVLLLIDWLLTDWDMVPLVKDLVSSDFDFLYHA